MKFNFSNPNYTVSPRSIAQNKYVSIYRFSSLCLKAIVIRQNIIIRTTKQFKQPCKNESSILPYLPPLCSPRRTGAFARYPHVHSPQRKEEASVLSIR